MFLIINVSFKRTDALIHAIFKVTSNSCIHIHLVWSKKKKKVKHLHPKCSGEKVYNVRETGNTQVKNKYLKNALTVSTVML